MDGKIFKVFISFFSVLVLAPEEISAQFLNISRRGWLQLEELQDYICLLSTSYDEVREHTPVAGWFCVKEDQCIESKTTHALPQVSGSQSDFLCQDFRYNEGRDVCCYIAGLNPPLDVKEEDFSAYLYTKPSSKQGDVVSLQEQKASLILQTKTQPPTEKTFETHQICGVVPDSVENGFTKYHSYVCVEEGECTERVTLPVSVRYEVGDAFCQRGSHQDGPRPTCCHISAISQGSVGQKSWVYKEFRINQTFAPGFRSSFMCEQYSRLTCDGPRDRCALRVLNRDTAVPGEFPHQALVGVISHRIQFFHCAGSLISKYFVLTAYDCQSFNGLDATLVLLGGYNSDNYYKGSFEQVTYIKKHYTEIESHFFMLARLWRPVRLNPFVRPACLDWFSTIWIGSQYRAREFDFGTAWMTGYGPTDNKDQFNRTLKRYQFTKNELSDIDKCEWKVPKNKRVDFVLGDSASHICLGFGKRFSLKLFHGVDYKGGQGHYDMGAPLSVLRNYCIWNVYGIAIQNAMYAGKPPTLVETVPAALAWIEDIVWKVDFSLLDFDMSIPECDGPSNTRFRGMKFLKEEYNKLYM